MALGRNPLDELLAASQAGGGQPVGADPNAVGTGAASGDLSDDQLQQLVAGGQGDPNAMDPSMAQDDTQMTPEERALQQQQIELAARRALAQQLGGM